MFNESERDIRTLRDALVVGTSRRALKLQRKLNIDRFARFGMTARKGLAYWSITHEFAEYLVERKDLIRKMMRHSSCGDEVFVATLLYNSPFKQAAYKEDDDPMACLRLSTWPIECPAKPRPGHNFILEDLDLLLSSPCLFALKFEGPDGIALQKSIRESMSNEA